MRRRRAGQGGFALLIVLWSMSLLALIGTQVTAAGRAESRIAGNLREAAALAAAADAAAQEAALHLIDGSAAGWRADGLPHLVRVGTVAVVVRAEAEGSKMPLNTAPSLLLAALVRQLGADQHVAKAIGDQIDSWRNPADFPTGLGAKAPQYRAAGRDWGPAGRPFRSVDELRLLLSMTPDLYARLAPHVSAFTQSAPGPKLADPVVARAMREASDGGLIPLSFEEPPIWHVLAVATDRAGARFAREAVYQLATEQDPPGKAVLTLDWRVATDAP